MSAVRVRTSSPRLRPWALPVAFAGLALWLAGGALADSTTDNGGDRTADRTANQVAKAPSDAPHDIAVAYLNALAGEGDQAARGHLLGGVPLAAQTYRIPNWNIVEREPVRRETAALPKVQARMKRLDERGRRALTEVLRLKTIKATDIDRARARELLRLTKEEATRFKKDFPVFAYVARVGKDVFWHPQNPWRTVMKGLGEQGHYDLELHLFRIEEREANRPPRVWPLRVLRIRSDKGYDSGWKVLPASDWDPEY